MSKKITLRDLEIRYQNIREQNPKVKKCSVKGCSNPIDSTPLLGEDTSCAYHRLLFDFWTCDVAKEPLKYTQKGRRRAFTNFMNRLGKDECDNLVLRMVQEGINWEC